MQVVLVQSFTHSYSREFGRPINAQNPDDYVISYRVIIDGQIIPYFDIEFRSRYNDYYLSSVREITDKFIPNGLFFKSKNQAIKKIEEIMNQIKPLN
jgi:hypothetical protein